MIEDLLAELRALLEEARNARIRDEEALRYNAGFVDATEQCIEIAEGYVE